jgi:hypothetical protein
MIQVLDVPVTCPYCRIGSGIIPVAKLSNGEERVEGLHDPIRCNACERFFLVRLRLSFTGEPIVGEPRVVPQGTILRNILGLT